VLTNIHFERTGRKKGLSNCTLRNASTSPPYLTVPSPNKMRSYLFKLVVVVVAVVVVVVVVLGDWIKSLFHNWSKVSGVLYREAKEDKVSREVITWYTQTSPDTKVS
jgi:hypothetical protein